VMNQQREVIYRQRRQALQEDNLKSVILEMVEDKAYELVNEHSDEKAPIKDWDIRAIESRAKKLFAVPLDLDLAEKENHSRDQVSEAIFEMAKAHYLEKERLIGNEQMRQLERFIVLQTVDTRWKEHLLSMDHLKEGIGLRGYAQQDPLRIYKKEGFAMFHGLMEMIKEEVVDILFKIQIANPERVEEIKKKEPQNLTFSHSDEPSMKKPLVRDHDKVQRNDICPCGSGKKYKKCCMS
ncbi:MAG: SEC-C domain-containing protein, partial [Proteobacteria bacterium]|nr:preprotein translocase subunit SecA [Desulfobacula sp.]MBU4130619.1 SEC-C domain-containing protein [Pseudomonadota bacterium]